MRRPDELREMCAAQFVRMYDTYNKTNNEEVLDEDEEQQDEHIEDRDDNDEPDDVSEAEPVRDSNYVGSDLYWE